MKYSQAQAVHRIDAPIIMRDILEGALEKKAARPPALATVLGSCKRHLSSLIPKFARRRTRISENPRFIPKLR
jgi:hypothetical protein